MNGREAPASAPPPRLARFEEFVRARPDEPFPRYALANEYRQAGRAEEALAQYRALVERRPEYVPTYLQLAGLLAELGLTRDAREACRSGLAAASRAGEARAVNELTAALEALPTGDER